MQKPSDSTIAIGLTNPKSPTNVGAVMRAAGCYQANEVYYTGQRYANAAKFNTDTKSINKTIPLTHINCLSELANQEKSIVVIELVEGATALPEFVHPKNALYIFGPEDGTVSQQVVDIAEHVVYVPTVGCMNLAATVNVTLYDRLAKQAKIEFSDALIRASRDTNNTIKVKN